VRLNYSLALFQKGVKEAVGANPAPEGIVVIFDSADGRIAGATMAEIQRMVKGEVRGKRFGRRVIWIRWRRSGGLDIRDAGGKSFHHRGHRGNVRFEEGRCRVEKLPLCFR
jgi:hypothetical protein